MERLLDVRAAADTAGVTTQYIRILLMNGVLVAGDVEGAITVTRASLQEWMRRRKAKRAEWKSREVKGGKREREANRD